MGSYFHCQQRSIEHDDNTGVSLDSTSSSSAASGNMPPSSMSDAAFCQVDFTAIIRRGKEENWLLSPQDVHLQALVGAGGFGEVFRGTLYGATPIAVKVAKDATTHGKLNSLSTELRFLRRVRHPNIVLFYGVVVDVAASSFALVLEWVTGCMLHIFVSKLDLEDECNTVLATDIAHGIHYLHSQTPAIVHHDLKPANVMVEDIPGHPKAKILDFGLSALRATQSRAGTRKYMAPEIILGKQHGRPADVYAYGCVLLLLFARVPPPESCAYVPHAFVKWPTSHHTSKIPLVAGCLKEDPDLRPTFDIILSTLGVNSGDGASGTTQEPSLDQSSSSPISPDKEHEFSSFGA